MPFLSLASSATGKNETTDYLSAFAFFDSEINRPVPDTQAKPGCLRMGCSRAFRYTFVLL
jgi:hypothetical protein